MKIYISHSKKVDFKKELYRPLRESQLNAEHKIILPHEVYETATDFPSREVIRDCDLVIAEVSYSATGLGVELGWANAFECPIICIYRKGAKLSGSLKVICDDFIEYEDEVDMIKKIAAALDNFKKEN